MLLLPPKGTSTIPQCLNGTAATSAWEGLQHTQLGQRGPCGEPDQHDAAPLPGRTVGPGCDPARFRPLSLLRCFFRMSKPTTWLEFCDAQGPSTCSGKERSRLPPLLRFINLNPRTACLKPNIGRSFLLRSSSLRMQGRPQSAISDLGLLRFLRPDFAEIRVLPFGVDSEASGGSSPP